MKTRAGVRRDDETRGTFYRGRIQVLQKRRGYRFSADAPILADFIRTRESDDILELGTGCGIVSLLLSFKPFRHIIALEIQESLADLARRNVVLNELEERITVVREDWRSYRPGRKFDLVFSNPPYIQKATGFLSRTAEKSIAKHELRGHIGNVMHLTADLLEKDGRACFIYPEKRREDFIEAARAAGLSLSLLRSVHPREGAPANLFLSELRFRPDPPSVLPPLLLYGIDGAYTTEAEEIFSGRGVGPL